MVVSAVLEFSRFAVGSGKGFLLLESSGGCVVCDGWRGLVVCHLVLGVNIGLVLACCCGCVG